MKVFLAAAVILFLLNRCLPAAAQEVVHFPSLDDNGPGEAATVLDGYLFRPAGEGAHAAVVGMHGCSGMAGPNGMFPIYRQWGAELARQGYLFLLVDSFGPRHHGEMCSIEGFDLSIYRKRPKDAYGGLAWLQAQPGVRADRIALAGWSQGGGVTLLSIGQQSWGRPAGMTQPDFRAAVTFYPGSCNTQRLPGWVNVVPLLILSGAEDVWTPTPPCKEMVDGAVARGAPIEMQVYPDAYHGFDAPNVSRRELPRYKTRAGVIPIVGTDPAARADALARVPAFLSRFLN